MFRTTLKQFNAALLKLQQGLNRQASTSHIASKYSNQNQGFRLPSYATVIEYDCELFLALRERTTLM